MKSTHPFHFPYVIKQIGEFLTVSVPDFEITVGEKLSHNPKVDHYYVTTMKSLIAKAALKVAEKLERLEHAGKKHYRPASLVRQSLQITGKEHLSSTIAAKYLGISVATLKRWELSGVIDAEKGRGGHRRFVLAELDRVKNLMESGKKPKSKKERELEIMRELLEKSLKHKSIES